MSETNDSLEDYYQLALKQADENHKIGIFFASIAAIMIFIGVFLVYVQIITLSVSELSSISGIILGAVSVLFFKRSDDSHKRLDRIFTRYKDITILKTKLSIGKSICSEIHDTEKKDKLLEELLEDARKFNN
ncbi:MAG: hypothetical protein ABR909_06575 [Candidatus Bathyarchaeia archaeon]|jgi:hypothetical protein